MNDQAYYDICWDRYNNSDDEENWRGGDSKEENKTLKERKQRILDCSGCGESWFRDENQDSIEWCDKCPWKKMSGKQGGFGPLFFLSFFLRLCLTRF